ncbi:MULTISPECIES: hypothetical protein [Geobacteraceae]|uniref:hypothetical protein n=1 Tax=Geobacteraceae TaxID=213422 RepID=UPI00117A977D|nr:MULTISPECIES: hypothetical protein [Geobacteraceae]
MKIIDLPFYFTEFVVAVTILISRAGAKKQQQGGVSGISKHGYCAYAVAKVADILIVCCIQKTVAFWYNGI